MFCDKILHFSPAIVRIWLHINCCLCVILLRNKLVFMDRKLCIVYQNY